VFAIVPHCVSDAFITVIDDFSIKVEIMSTKKSRTQKMEVIRDLMNAHINEHFDGNISDFARTYAIPYSTLQRIKALGGLPSGKTYKKLAQAIPSLQLDVDKPLSNGVTSSTSGLENLTGEDEMELLREMMEMVKHGVDMTQESILGRMSAIETTAQDRFRSVDDRITSLANAISTVQGTHTQTLDSISKRLGQLEEAITFITKKIVDEGSFSPPPKKPE
jgi:hypothetical protein